MVQANCVVSRSPSLRWLLVSFVAFSSLALGRCGNPSGPTPPPPPPVNELVVACPAGLTIENVPQLPAPVTYLPPTVTGGVEPTTVTCTHPSGGNFNGGTTDVVCTARDSASPQRQAQCIFSVTVKQSFSVGATRFLAFGDSITAGEVEYNVSGASVLDVEVSKAYPTLLRSMLTARYPQQSITLHNAGSPGQPASCPVGSSFCGVNDISQQVVSSQAQVLLLMQGVVDLAGGGGAAIDPMIEGLKFMIRDAKRRGVTRVFLGTLLPEKRGSRSYAMDYIVPANDEIRDLASREGVDLVDLYAGMVGKEATLIGNDGLHPTPEGYEVMATLFFEAIKSKLETVVTTSAGSQRVLRVSATDGANVEIGPQLFGPPVRIRQR